MSRAASYCSAQLECHFREFIWPTPLFAASAGITVRCPKGDARERGADQSIAEGYCPRFIANAPTREVAPHPAGAGWRSLKSSLPDGVAQAIASAGSGPDQREIRLNSFATTKQLIARIDVFVSKYNSDARSFPLDRRSRRRPQ